MHPKNPKIPEFSQDELSALYILIKMYVDDLIIAPGYHGEDDTDETYEPVSKKELGTLMKKIKAVMGKTASSKAENVFIEAKYGDWNRMPDEDIMDKVEEAMDSKRTASMEYFSPDSGLSRRNIDIYAKNARYTVGFCHLRKDIRKFRNSRIVSIKLLREKFEVLEDFNKKEFL